VDILIKIIVRLSPLGSHRFLSHLICLSFKVIVSYINKIQQDATVCRYLFTAKITLHVWGVHRTHH